MMVTAVQFGPQIQAAEGERKKEEKKTIFNQWPSFLIKILSFDEIFFGSVM